MIEILIRYVLIIVVIFVAMLFAKVLMRKVFRIEKVSGEAASYKYVNPLHRQVNKTYRNFAVVILFVILIVDVVYFDESLYLFIGALFLSTLTQMLMKAFFEWKYAKTPKQFLLTLTEIVVLVVAVVVVLQFGLL